jgi:RHS repeat-associated protein
VSGVTTPYLYDGQNPAMISSNQLLMGSGLDEIYAQISSSGTTSYLRDGLNNTVADTNNTAAVTANYSFSPYGGSTNTGTPSTSMQYTGRENDGATGLYYYRARYYSPQLVRFISEDPIGLAGGTNFYAYAEADPLSFTDPSGLDVTVTQYDAAHGFGHIGTAVNSSVTQGLYPVKDGLAVVAGADVPGEIRTDSEPVIDSITIHTSPVQDILIRAAIDKARKNPPKYNLYSNNCAQESAQFLNAGGLKVPRDTLPKNYFNALKSLFKNQLVHN